MADSETQQPVDSTQQVTSTVPATAPAKVPVINQKNPNRVKAGKAIAEKTRLAREAQNKKWPRLK